MRNVGESGAESALSSTVISLSLFPSLSFSLYTHTHTKTTHLDISHASQSLNFQEELQQRAERWPPNFQLLSALCFFFFHPSVAKKRNSCKYCCGLFTKHYTDKHAVLLSYRLSFPFFQHWLDVTKSIKKQVKSK